MADRFFIGKYDQDSGLQTDFKPWAIADQAFAELTNAYVFRGRVRKRFGSRWLSEDPNESRLRVLVSATDAGGNAAGSVPLSGGLPIVTPAIGQQFSIGTEVFTVVVLGNPAILLKSGSTVTATFNTTTGAFVFAGATAFTLVYYYPALPVMGLQTFESTANSDQKIIGFDTRFAYEYNIGWQRLGGEVTPGAAQWQGSDSEFFWTTTWQGNSQFERFFFVTNFDETDPNFMRFYNPNIAKWQSFAPVVSSQFVPNTFLLTARILVPFKNRLLAFNTWEGNKIAAPNNFANRCRYSGLLNPITNPSWDQFIPGNGNAIDAPTTEAIVSVEFIKDRLIVFFTNSTWELVYTGNQSLPFAWQQINTELGAESTFSIVPFDKICLGIGNVGIHACNGANVERIDTKIPQSIFNIHYVDNGLARVNGIRDFFVEMVYWAFPDTSADPNFPYPNQVLVYNYKTGTWAFNEDSITVFGYFQQLKDITWDSNLVTWDDYMPWSSGSIEAKFRQIIAGNQEGFTFICDSEEPTNAAVIQITNLTFVGDQVTVKAINHNFRDSQYIYFEGITQNPLFVGNLPIINNQIFMIDTVIDKDTFQFSYVDLAGTVLAGIYSGGGLISRVSNISIKTKEYNFYANKGKNAYISKVDFMVDQTDLGSIQVDFYVSSGFVPLLEDSAASGTLVGTGTLDTFSYTAANGVAAPIPFEDTQARLWHPVYLQAEGEVVQLQLTMNDAQMRNIDIRLCDFQLHAMVIFAQSTSRLQ